MRVYVLAVCVAGCVSIMPACAETRTAIPTQYGGGAFSPDGRVLAVGTAKGEITLYSPDSGKVVDHLRRRDNHRPEHIAWRPDGKRLVSASMLVLHDTESRQEISVPSDFSKLRMKRIGWSPDGQTLFGVASQSVIVWSPDSDEQPRIIMVKDQYNWSGALSPDAKSLVSMGEHGYVHLFDLASGGNRELPTGYGWCECYIDWHPRRNILALSGHSRSSHPRVKPQGENKIRLWDLKTNQLLFDLQGPAKGAILCFSPNGRTLAVAHGWLNRWSSSDPDADITLWDVKSGELRHTLQTGEQQVRFLAWSADSKQLASGGPFATYVREGKEIVYKTQRMKVSLWNPQAGQLVRTLDRE